jgi:hypothetical protein
MVANPYQYVAPVPASGRFCGREAELRRAREIVSKAACLSLVGGPHCGLTSLLLHIGSEGFREQCEQLSGPLMFIYVNCLEQNDPLEIILYLLHHANPDRPMPTVPPRWRSLQGTLISTLSNLRQKGRRVVLLLDDFETLGSKEGAVEFLESLRALSQRIEMTMITTTRTELKNCCHQDVVSSPFPNIFQVEYVEAWHADELAAFVQESSSDSGVDLTPYVALVDRWSGRIPYLAQLACARLYDVVAAGQQPDEQAVYAVLVRDAQQCLQDIWNHLSSREQQTLVEITRGHRPGEVSSSLIGKGYVIAGKIPSAAIAAFVQQVA